MIPRRGLVLAHGSCAQPLAACLCLQLTAVIAERSEAKRIANV